MMVSKGTGIGWWKHGLADDGGANFGVREPAEQVGNPLLSNGALDAPNTQYGQGMNCTGVPGRFDLAGAVTETLTNIADYVAENAPGGPE